MLSKRVLAGGTLAAIALVSSVAVVARQGNSPSIVGVWRVSEVTFTGPNARKLTNPQPGLRIFTQRHYSINEVTAEKSRPELPDAPAQATDKAGTYEIRGNEITTRPIAAKSPNTMRPKNFNTSAIVLDGKTLTITPKSNQAGPIANPTTIRLTRIE